MRSTALVIASLCLVGCKKHKPDEVAQDQPPAEPSRGHSITHFKDGGTLQDPDQMPVETTATGDAAAGAADAEAVDASTIGGNGAPAYRDEQGHPHGPGGPVYMGRSTTPCDASKNHCMRDGVWFAADSYDNKHLFRATPAFELEGKWWNWRGAEVDSGKLFKTELATVEKTHAGSPVIVWLPETDGSRWAENEYAALTSSRWDVAVVTSVNPAVKSIRIPSWPDDLPLENARVIVEQKSH